MHRAWFYCPARDQRDAGPVPFFALAGCVDPGKESMAVRAQCLGGHIALPRRATERRPVVSTQAKRVWPSGYRTTLPGSHNSPFRRSRSIEAPGAYSRGEYGCSVTLPSRRF